MSGVDRLDEPPPGFVALARGTQRGLLRAEAAALRDLRQHNRAAVATVLAALTAGQFSKRIAIHSVATAATVLREATIATVAAARESARGLAAGRVTAQLARINRVVGADIQPPPADFARDHDAVLAAAAGESTSAAFRAIMLATVLRREGDAVAVRAAGATLDGRARSTATTEVATALADEHAALVNHIARDRRNLAFLPLLAKRWDDKLDGHVCKVCRAHHGEIALLTPHGAEFRNGDVPGKVHRSCRCVDTLIALPLPIAKVA